MPTELPIDPPTKRFKTERDARLEEVGKCLSALRDAIHFKPSSEISDRSRKLAYAVSVAGYCDGHQWYIWSRINSFEADWRMKGSTLNRALALEDVEAILRQCELAERAM